MEGKTTSGAHPTGGGEARARAPHRVIARLKPAANWLVWLDISSTAYSARWLIRLYRRGYGLIRDAGRWHSEKKHQLLIGLDDDSVLVSANHPPHIATGGPLPARPCCLAQPHDAGVSGQMLDRVGREWIASGLEMGPVQGVYWADSRSAAATCSLQVGLRRQQMRFSPPVSRLPRTTDGLCCSLHVHSIARRGRPSSPPKPPVRPRSHSTNATRISPPPHLIRPFSCLQVERHLNERAVSPLPTS